MDWFTRWVIVWRVLMRLEADFCVQALREEVTQDSAPEIFSTDQGSHFTSMRCIKVLTDREIKIKTTGKGG